jgi:DNA polymerase I
MSYFRQVVVADFEYEVEPGGLPNPLCMVAHVLVGQDLRLAQTIKLWRGEFGSAPPFDIGADTLFVAYSAWAEMTCFKVLSWQFPTYVFDQHTAYLAASNLLLPYNPNEEEWKKQRRRLPDACRAFGIEGWQQIDKDIIAADVGAGRWQQYGQEGVFQYCEEDVRMSALLFRAQLRGYPGWLPAADVSHIIRWSDYSAKAVALIQARGMLIDMVMWNLVQENKAAVIFYLLQQFDPSFNDAEPIYSPDGTWNYTRFERWLMRAGIYAWPRLDSGQLDISADAFRIMYGAHPAIEGLHALRDSIGFIAKARLPIGKDGRNRPSLFPLGAATGRNAHARSPYNASAGMRGFMVCPEGSIISYLDWRSQEVGIGAVLSGDEALKADYTCGDVYHGLAQLCGLTADPDPIRWKKEHRSQRDRMKPLELGIRYGMSVTSLARGLGVHPLIAATILRKHQEKYPRFWWWRDDVVKQAMLAREIESIDGWPLRLTTSPNKRTLYNFPMQSGGAAMLRLAATRLCEAGIVPTMLIHDGILFEETNPEKLLQAREIMLQTGRDLLGGFEIGVSEDQRLTGGQRYRDKRPMAVRMWATVNDALENIGAFKRAATG